MVSWYADGGVTGFRIFDNTPQTGWKALGADVIKLATNGTVDANGITRLQYPVVPGSTDAQYKWSGLSGVGRINFTQADLNAAVSAGRYAGVSMFITEASNFAANFKPTPLQILQLGSSKVTVLRGVTTNIVGQSTPYGQVGNKEYTFGEFKITEPNRKYWVLVMPITFIDGTSPSVDNDASFGNPNTLGRAVSVWSNRTPLAPTIISPTSDITTSAGGTFTLTFKPNDPDLYFGAEVADYYDMAGVQVQYAPRPTLQNPNPEWIDMPVTGAFSPFANFPGWFIDESVNNQVASVNYSPDSQGPGLFYRDQTMTVLCGGLPGGQANANRGRLPAGSWQVRLRTFDYGHMYPQSGPPLNLVSRNTTPSTYPAANASPWSKPFRVTVAAQVPPPIPVSPIDNIAIDSDQPITLSWQYRNTFTPVPKKQFRRVIEVRKVGDPDWVQVTDSVSESTSYTITGDTIIDTPYSYLANPGFEASPGNTDGFTVNTGSVGVVNNAANAHGGTRYLSFGGAGLSILSRTITLRAQDTLLTFSAWSQRFFSTKHTLVVTWLNSSGDPVQTSSAVDFPVASGWQYAELVDLVRPPGAVQAQVGILPTGTQSTSERFDDFTLTSRTGTAQGTVTFTPTNQYEWRVKVYDTAGVVSEWSPVARFYIVPVPNSGAGRPLPLGTVEGATLGCGKHTVAIYRRGGQRKVGELSAVSRVRWGRVRDDISTAEVVVSDFGVDCGALLKRLKSWAYEVVIFRNNGYTVDRVWEGPITLLTYEKDKVTIDAKDVMVHPYRRIVKQEMNETGSGSSVVGRATKVIQNVMAPSDPNVLAYLTPFTDAGDAKAGNRALPPYSRTGFEEVDDMAANAGLDYTTVGRRILLWGTKRRIGTLPEFTDEDLGASPIVSEYGMSAANVYSVSDGNGVHGEAFRLGSTGVDDDYGLVEMLSSSWASDSPVDTGTYSQAGLETTRKSFEDSAERSISDRWPPPVIVRIPDNTTLNPSVVLSIQQLVPGVVVPLRSTSTLREVVGFQKLDSVQVNEVKGKETISITMSPFSRDDSDVEEGA